MSVIQTACQLWGFPPPWGTSLRQMLPPFPEGRGCREHGGVTLLPFQWLLSVFSELQIQTNYARGRRYGDICIHIADSLCYTAATNTTL